ncbi:hypothetical protein TL16_g00206 [Triparma laevis f. inornata]|uniref:MFS transporter n=1 Tax=Triparma laevis f. inornata TaxID=1714386 RepID=A0A9W7DM32_9STRA|nr:hypothetical protein TL16_g00206 [Triparma laevis f. inornata]
MSVGSIYCWSMWTPKMTTLSGVVASGPVDFTLSEVVPVFSCAAVGLGMGSAALGSWVDKVGPVKAGTTGSLIWFSGLMTAAAGAHLHSLPLIYAGYGGLGGIAWGLLYLSPVSTTMKWFPDRRGLATGITLSAFGAGAAIAPPMIDYFTQIFFEAPGYLGTVADLALMTLDDGSQVLANDPGTQVVVATATDAAKVGLSEGVYAAGTGDSGAAGAFASLACLYGGVGLVSSQFMRAPPDGWMPDGYKVAEDNVTGGTDVGLPLKTVIRTPQFPLLWMTVFGNAVGGLALISSSKMVMVDIWGAALPSIVTASFATGYVATLGSANAFGRLSWAVGSDFLGRKNAYSVMALGIPVMGSVPFLISNAIESNAAGVESVVPLGIFVGGSVFAIANYGGIFSILPAYIADLYGSKYSSSIHGAALTAWSASAVAGPMGLAFLRNKAEREAIDDLTANLDPTLFEQTFGATLEHKDSLIESKTLTINKLMQISAEGVPDPTPHLYDQTFYMAAGFLGVAAISNQLLKPPNVKKLLADSSESENELK